MVTGPRPQCQETVAVPSIAPCRNSIGNSIPITVTMGTMALYRRAGSPPGGVPGPVRPGRAAAADNPAAEFQRTLVDADVGACLLTRDSTITASPCGAAMFQRGAPPRIHRWSCRRRAASPAWICKQNTPVAVTGKPGATASEEGEGHHRVIPLNTGGWRCNPAGTAISRLDDQDGP